MCVCHYAKEDQISFLNHYSIEFYKARIYSPFYGIPNVVIQ
jgi:hypothetical protein